MSPNNHDTVAAGATLDYLIQISDKIKEYRSTINEKWATPSSADSELDSVIHSELDRVTDATERIILSFRALQEGDQEKAKQTASEALSEVIKSTSAALDRITDAMREEADKALRFRTIRRGEFGRALDARGEGRQYAKEARIQYEKDEEEAIGNYIKAIEKFSEAIELSARGGFEWGWVILNLMPLILAILAILLSLTPLGDSLKHWVADQFFR